MFASASEYNSYNPLREDLFLNPSSFTSWMEKNTTSGVYVYNYGQSPVTPFPHSFYAAVWERKADGSQEQNAHGGTFNIYPGTDAWLPNYVVEDGCDMAALYCQVPGYNDVGWVSIGWAADAR